MSFAHLPEEQARRAEQLFESLKSAAEHDLRAIAELLATKPDEQLVTVQCLDYPSSLGAGSPRRWAVIACSR